MQYEVLLHQLSNKAHNCSCLLQHLVKLAIEKNFGCRQNRSVIGDVNGNASYIADGAKQHTSVGDIRRLATSNITCVAIIGIVKCCQLRQGLTCFVNSQNFLNNFFPNKPRTSFLFSWGNFIQDTIFCLLVCLLLFCFPLTRRVTFFLNEGESENNFCCWCIFCLVIVELLLFCCRGSSGCLVSCC